MKCAVCDFPGLEFVIEKREQYWRCKACGAVAVKQRISVHEKFKEGNLIKSPFGLNTANIETLS